jgi:glucose-fructose oxidoreductase
MPLQRSKPAKPAKPSHEPGIRAREGAGGRASEVRYAVVGLGYISQVAVLPAFRNARRNSRLVTLVSGDETKRRELARRHRVRETYDYEQFAHCLGQVDAVYIALPNHLHRDFAITAAEAGVHVLCEKPLAPTVEDCERMIAAAEARDVRLMTAYRLHFERASLKSIELARDGALGQLRFFSSAFAMQVREGNVRLLDESLGGGPLYDLGVYCINAARHLFGAEPIEVMARAANDGERRFAETHEMVSCLLRFPGERLATFTCGAGSADVGWYELVGASGTLRMDPAFELAEALEQRVTIDGRTTKARYPKRDQFAPQLLHFSDCVLAGREPEPSGREGWADVRVITALLESARTGRAVGLDPIDAVGAPSIELERHRPPVERPELVNALPPSPS